MEIASGAYQGDAGHLVYLPLGGTGEIGMNLNLYGLDNQWLMVDLGITFGDERTPGVDIITPDPQFIEQRRDQLLGLVITHGHEDHIGAIPHLWEDLQCPIYATAFTAALIRGKLRDADLEDRVPLNIIPQDAEFELGPFRLKYISITHSIPESFSIAIRTRHGTILHTGDWKLDPTPLLGHTTDEAGFRALGDDGILALVCDSTNVLSPGTAGSETDVRKELVKQVAAEPNRVAITTFASNAARLATAAHVAAETGRSLVLVGRSMHRILSVGRETGYFDDIGAIVNEREAVDLPRDKVLYLCTGCQGEPRGAMARIAAGDHRFVKLEAGDTAIFSSKIIPGNELTIGWLHNQLAQKDIKVITELDADIHVSGHPCQEDLATLYQWAKPQIAVPTHGENRHLIRHARLARELQVPHAFALENGQMLKLAPGTPEVVDQVETGRLALDGDTLVPVNSDAIQVRKRLMFNGGGVVTMVLNNQGKLAAPVDITLQGVVLAEELPELVDELRLDIDRELQRTSTKQRQNDKKLAEAVRIVVRRRLKNYTGKRPVIEARVIRLN